MMAIVTSEAFLLSLWFPNDVQPNNKSNTIVIEFTIINGTLITVLTDRIRFISWDLIPGSSPNPPIPWSVPQPMFLRKRSSCNTAMAFTHSRAACNREYSVKAMVNPQAEPDWLLPGRRPGRGASTSLTSWLPRWDHRRLDMGDIHPEFWSGELWVEWALVFPPPPQLPTEAGNSGMLERCLTDEWWRAVWEVGPPLPGESAKQARRLNLGSGRKETLQAGHSQTSPARPSASSPATSAVSLVTPAWAVSAATSAAAVAVQRARCQLFASQREKKGENWHAWGCRREVETQEEGSSPCPPPARPRCLCG